MHAKELQTVRFAMLALFSGLMIVYLLLYQIKGEKVITELTATSERIGITTGNNDTTGTVLVPIEELSGSITGTLPTRKSSLFDSLKTKTGTQTAVVQNTGIHSTWTVDLHILSGTSLRYGLIEGAEKVGLSYEYALKESKKDIILAKLPKEDINLSARVQQAGWSIHTIVTEEDILKNKLFGDKISFINLPEYKDKKVLMILWINDEIRFLQMDTKVYHTSKWYIKTLFIK